MKYFKQNIYFIKIFFVFNNNIYGRLDKLKLDEIE